jgi:hypothetical protein
VSSDDGSFSGKEICDDGSCSGKAICDDGSCSGKEICVTTVEVNKDETNLNQDLAQKFGVLAIGESVCRVFDEHGIFYGVITAYRKEGKNESYTVEYSDGDSEDLDTEEYNFAYALWLKEEGWTPDDVDEVTTKKKLSKFAKCFCFPQTCCCTSNKSY